MNSYIISLIVTAEQENAIIDLYTERCWVYLKTDLPPKLVDLPGELAEELQLKSPEAIISDPHRKIASEQRKTTTTVTETNHSSLNYDRQTREFVENLPFAIKTEATHNTTIDVYKLTSEAQEDSSTVTMAPDAGYRLVKCETECLYSSEDEREEADTYMETDTDTSRTAIENTPDTNIQLGAESNAIYSNSLQMRVKTFLPPHKSLIQKHASFKMENVLKKALERKMNRLKHPQNMTTGLEGSNTDKVPNNEQSTESFYGEILSGKAQAQNTDLDKSKRDNSVQNADQKKMKIDCEECKATFKTPLGYQSHKNRDGSCKSWNCEICGQVFHSGTKNFNVHLRTHIKQFNYQCQECKKKFANKRYLARHLKRCRFVENPFKCDACPYCCKEEYILHIHKLRHHRVGAGKFPCFKCPKEFFFLHTLSEHLICSHRLGNHQDVPCSICGKLMFSRYLKKHEETHTEIKQHKCEYCPAAFRTRGGLTSHRKIHSSERNHYCEHCGKGFHTQAKLTMHCRVHTGEKPYACPLCDYRCAIGPNLRKHMRIHDK